MIKDDTLVILSCGEALVDLMVQPVTKGSGMMLNAMIGGSPFNVAIGLSRLGIPAGFLGGISRDSFGGFLTTAMCTESVTDQYVARLDAKTALSLVDHYSEPPNYSFYGENSADTCYCLSDLPAKLSDTITCINFGSYSLVIEPCGSAFRTLMAREAAKRVISYDVNVRPSIEPDMQRWRTVLEDAIGYVDIIKASNEDIALLYPETDPAIIVEKWRAQGAAIAIITLGGDGVIACSEAGIIRQAAIPVTVVDTVGAGDSFQSAFLASISKSHILTKQKIKSISQSCLVRCLHNATEAAAITCRRQGADLPKLIDLLPANSKEREHFQQPED